MAFSLLNIGTHTFFDMMNKVNELASFLNVLNPNLTQIANTSITGTLFNLRSNTVAISVAGAGSGSPQVSNTIYLNVGTLVTDINDTSVSNVASANLVNTVYQYSRAVSNNINNTSNSIYIAIGVSSTQANNARTDANSAAVTAAAAYAQANLSGSGLTNFIGMMVPFAGNNAPSGFLLCQGQSVRRDTYASLFSVIGAMYGAANGVVFTIPDLQHRVVAGFGPTSVGRLTTSGGSANGAVMGSTGGSESVILSVAQLPSHTHSAAPANTVTTTESADHTHSVSITSGTESADHTHSISITSGTESADHTHSVSITSGAQSADHSHTYSGTTSGHSVGHTHTLNVTSGGGLADESSLAVSVLQSESLGSGSSNTVRMGGASIASSTQALGSATSQSTHTHSVSGTTSGVSADHTHTYSGTSSGVSVGHTHLVSGTSGGKSATHTHSVSGTSGGKSATHTHLVSGTSGGKSATHTHNLAIPAFNTGANGSGTVVGTVPPMIIANYVIYTGV